MPRHTLSKLTQVKYKEKILKAKKEEFPGGTMIRLHAPNAGGVGSIPGQGAKTPHASWPKKPKT